MRLQFAMKEALGQFIKAFINQTWLHRYGSPVPDETLTLLWSLTVSIFSIGGLLGSLTSGSLIRRYGKRRCMLCNNLLTLGASMIVGFSKMAGSFEMILVGRLINGINAGFGLNLCIMYLGEIAPKTLRGLINTATPVFATAGKLLGFIFGLREVLSTESLWPLLLALCAVTAILQLATFPFFPDTPPYLLLVKKDKEGCMKAMKKLWGERDHRTEIEDLMKEQSAWTNTKILSFLELVKDRSLRRQLCILCILVTSMQFSGVNAVYFYAYDVFRQAGFAEDRIPYIAIGIGGCEIVGTLLCGCFITKIGRKVLLLTGFGVMGGSLALLTVTLAFQGSYYWVPYCSVVLVFCYILFFGMGPSGVMVSICLEILTQAARPSGFVLISSLNWLALYVIGLIFPYIVRSMGHFCFLLFLGYLIIASIFLFLVLPETKGKSITEITDELRDMQCGKICCHGATKTMSFEHMEVTTF
ncbi:solute carrier family 2, facilitated glucose transporter member 11-like [Ambystoma mexicanum]|uniref:solute carrier family 2, facilitated glucose transporter member 11-like n=1 Tax=Ambystoma mexicanum TaxID=8296 RepID=UPI0037E73374